MIDCREAVSRMWAYLTQDLAAAPVAEFEAHLEHCQSCCGELEFSRHLRAVAAESEGGTPVPPDLRTRIDILLARSDATDGRTS